MHVTSCQIFAKTHSILCGYMCGPDANSSNPDACIIACDDGLTYPWSHLRTAVEVLTSAADTAIFISSMFGFHQIFSSEPS